jgi:hypothetical protein
MTEADPVMVQPYLRDEYFEMARNELKPLMKALNDAYGRLGMQLRQDHFNIYDGGNLLATVRFGADGTCEATVQSKSIGGMIEHLGGWSAVEQTRGIAGEYTTFKMRTGDLLNFFRRAHLDRMGKNNRTVRSEEEPTMEEAIVADNPPNRDFIIIDRQVLASDYSRVDLLCLKHRPNGKYGFEVIKLEQIYSLGLRPRAGEHVAESIQRIRRHLDKYSENYEKNYYQKRQLDLFREDMPNSIEIDREPGSVKGIVVSAGDSTIASEKC